MFKKIAKISLIIIIILAFILFVLITWQSNSIIKKMANIRVEKNSELIHKYQDEIDRIEIENSEGIKISSWRFKNQEPNGIVIILHGMHGQDASSLLDFGHFFHEAKYETFCLDLRAHGKSEGNEIGFGYTEVKDVIALLNWIRKEPRYENKKVILYGISMGGATAINVAAKRQDVSMVISASAFKTYTDTFLDSMRKENVPELVVNMFSPSIKIVLSTKYDMNFTDKTPINNIKNINSTPILLIHGDEDEQIPVQHAYDLKQASGDNVDLWIVEGAKHMIVDDVLASNNYWYRKKLIKFIESNM